MCLSHASIIGAYDNFSRAQDRGRLDRSSGIPEGIVCSSSPTIKCAHVQFLIEKKEKRKERLGKNGEWESYGLVARITQGSARPIRATTITINALAPPIRLDEHLSFPDVNISREGHSTRRHPSTSLICSPISSVRTARCCGTL